MFSSRTRIMGREGGTELGRPAVLTVFGWGASFQISAPHSSRVQLRTPPPLRRPPACSPHSQRQISDDQRPPCYKVGDTALPPMKLQVPAAPAQRPSLSHLRPKRVPELSARLQGLEIEQKRRGGRGKARVAEDTGWRTFRGSREPELAFRLPLCSPQLLGAETAACAPRLPDP